MPFFQRLDGSRDGSSPGCTTLGAAVDQLISWNFLFETSHVENHPTLRKSDESNWAKNLKPLKKREISYHPLRELT